MPKSFKPVIDERAEILILGTMPGEASLRAAQYYAHKQNKFWPVIFALFAGGRAPLDYADKLAVLQKNKLALWDSLAACIRRGSLDGDIRAERPNKIPALLKKYGGIKRIIFNGRAAHGYFVKHFGAPEDFCADFFVMPSTSAANAKMSFAQKLSVWEKGLKMLPTKLL
ncbi:MAG: DNA-deoxyinosine glycosylase [Elusimicrobiota bacterium]|jgi:hypoxanthine-DNA glycosylase|nr:DNA-deoxyinosine glycosylase [Elusimicrobiota bacterium]